MHFWWYLVGWWVGSSVITICRLFYVKLFVYIYIYIYVCVCVCVNEELVVTWWVFTACKMWNSSIWPIDRTLYGATSPGQSGSGSDGNEEVFHIPQSSSITEDSPSDCLVPYIRILVGRWVLPLCKDAVGVLYFVKN